MLQKIIANRIALLIIGAIAIVAGFVMMSQAGGDVTCGGKVMKPGDSCTGNKQGSKSRSYAEMKSEQSTNGYAALCIGTLMLAAGATGLVLHSRQNPAATPR